MSRLLVIDACIARASGGPDAIHPTASMCRDFLSQVLKICHRMVLSEEIREEWNRHQSHFARRWRVSMAARKKIVFVDPEEEDSIRDKIRRRVENEKRRNAILKDFHVIEAALAAESLVISIDREAGGLLAGLSREGLGEISSIIWVDPSLPEETAIEWLENGAQSDCERKLSARLGNAE